MDEMDELEEFFKKEKLEKYNTKSLLQNGNNISIDEIFNKIMYLYEYYLSSFGNMRHYNIKDIVHMLSNMDDVSDFYSIEYIDIEIYYNTKNYIKILKKILKKMQKIQLEDICIELMRPERVLSRLTTYENWEPC